MNRGSVCLWLLCIHSGVAEKSPKRLNKQTKLEKQMKNIGNVALAESRLLVGTAFYAQWKEPSDGLPVRRSSPSVRARRRSTPRKFCFWGESSWHCPVQLQRGDMQQYLRHRNDGERGNPRRRFRWKKRRNPTCAARMRRAFTASRLPELGGRCHTEPQNAVRGQWGHYERGNNPHNHPCDRYCGQTCSLCMRE